MKRKFRRGFAVIATLVCSGGLLACSNARHKPELQARLITQIDSQGIKQFQLVMQHEPPRNRPGKSSGRKGPPPGGGDRGKPPGGRGDFDDFAEREQQREAQVREQLHDLLAQKISEVAYCREGYNVTDEQIAFALQPSLRGACVEKATEQDRLTFASQEAPQGPLVIYEDLGG